MLHNPLEDGHKMKKEGANGLKRGDIRFDEPHRGPYKYGVCVICAPSNGGLRAMQTTSAMSRRCACMSGRGTR